MVKHDSVQLWKVQRMAAMRSHHFHNIKTQLESYIENKWEVKTYD